MAQSKSFFLVNWFKIANIWSLKAKANRYLNLKTVKKIFIVKIKNIVFCRNKSVRARRRKCVIRVVTFIFFAETFPICLKYCFKCLEQVSGRYIANSPSARRFCESGCFSSFARRWWSSNSSFCFILSLILILLNKLPFS